jgi:hypothetical protein
MKLKNKWNKMFSIALSLSAKVPAISIPLKKLLLLLNTNAACGENSKKEMK